MKNKDIYVYMYISYEQMKAIFIQKTNKTGMGALKRNGIMILLWLYHIQHFQDDIVDAGEDVVDAVVDGTDLVGDALSDAYNAAADKAAFVANTVIDTVEQAMAILTNDFDFSANCPNWNGPSLSVDNNGISVDWGRQRCRVTLVGQSLTLFDMNFGSTNVNFPDPLTAMIDVGKQVAGCLDDGNALNVFKCVAKTIGEELLADVPAFKILFSIAQQVVGCTGDALDVFACTAKKIGDILLQTLPPFNILTNLGTMLSESWLEDEENPLDMLQHPCRTSCYEVTGHPKR